MIALASRRLMPNLSVVSHTGRHSRLALAFTSLIGLALGTGMPAFATSVSQTVSVNGEGYNGVTLKTGGLYAVQVNLNPAASKDYGYASGAKSQSCGGDRTSSPEYCVTDIRSHLVGAPVISGVTFDGSDFSDSSTVSGDTLSFLDGSYIPGTHVIAFTETFSEARNAYSYFYGNKNPSTDGYSPSADRSARLIPGNFSGSLLSCGFSGSTTYSVPYSYETISFNTVATCSLNLTYAFPDSSPIPVPPLPIPGVPEPATWAMMVIGFGAIGAAMRRRAWLAATHA